MMIHHAKVRSTSAHPITKEEHARYSEQLASFQMPLIQMSAYRQLQDPDRPFAMRQKADAFSLPIVRNLFGLYEVRLLVNGQALRFIIDTGAQISGIRKQRAQVMHLEGLNGTLEVGSVGSTKLDMGAVRADSLCLGEICWDNVPLVLLDQQRFSLPFLQSDLLRFDGILGWDLLSRLDFELDTIEKRFKVVKNRYRFDHPNLIPCSFPTLIVREADGTSSLFGIDTGAKQSWLGSAYIERRDLPIVSEAKIIGFGVHGREELQTPIVDRLHVYADRADITLHGCISAFVEIFPGHPYDGIFGNEIFAGRRIRFVNSRNMLLLA